MKSYKIRFRDLKDKCRFLDVSTQSQYNIDLEYGNLSCDGKSVLGVVSTMPENMDIKATFITEKGDVLHDFSPWLVGIWGR